MRAVVQRVTSASVTVAGEVVGSIAEPGLLVLVGATHDDTAATAEALADKVWNLRIMAGERSCADLAAPLLVVSQFTLYGDTKKGYRPSFIKAAKPPLSVDAYELFLAEMNKQGLKDVQHGEFGADMQVALVNEGPCTIIIDTDEWKKKE